MRPAIGVELDERGTIFFRGFALFRVHGPERRLFDRSGSLMDFERVVIQ
jgi:hypothetical protein